MHAASLLLALCILASNVHAKQQRGAFSPTGPVTARTACGELRWHADWLSWFPRIAEGCQGVVKLRGQRWARMQAKFIRHRDDGALVSQLLDGKGNLLGGITLLPAAGQGISLKGRRYWFSEVVGEQLLHLYVPEGELAVASQPGAPPEQYSLIIRPGVDLTQTEIAAAPLSNDAAQTKTASAGWVSNTATNGRTLAPLRSVQSSSSSLLASAVGLMSIVFAAILWLRRQH